MGLKTGGRGEGGQMGFYSNLKTQGTRRKVRVIGNLNYVSLYQARRRGGGGSRGSNELPLDPKHR